MWLGFLSVTVHTSGWKSLCHLFLFFIFFFAQICSDLGQFVCYLFGLPFLFTISSPHVLSWSGLHYFLSSSIASLTFVFLFPYFSFVYYYSGLLLFYWPGTVSGGEGLFSFHFISISHISRGFPWMMCCMYDLCTGLWVDAMKSCK